MTRFLYPVLAVLLVGATLAQVRANRGATRVSRVETAAAVAGVVAEGRLVAYPDAQVVVGSDAAGTIERLAVREKDRVRRGDLIALIRADDTRAALSQARARVGEADADIRLFELETTRAKDLWTEEVGSKQAWEKAERDLDAARARRASALADVKRLEALNEKTIITAPIDGTVVTRDVDTGERVEDGQALVTLADLSRTRIEAEVDEFDAARMRLGAPVEITAEGSDATWKGTVEEIPDAVTSRRLNPQDPSKPIDTRVLLVKIALAAPAPLKLGQRVEVTILQ